MDPVVSICLGTPDVSVGEMVSGYTTFANKGIRVEPLYVTRIEDPYGNTIANFNSQMSEVLTEDASYKMLHMLKNVIDGGTGGRIRARYGIKAPMEERPVRRRITPTVGLWVYAELGIRCLGRR